MKTYMTICPKWLNFKGCQNWKKNCILSKNFENYSNYFDEICL